MKAGEWASPGANCEDRRENLTSSLGFEEGGARLVGDLVLLHGGEKGMVAGLHYNSYGCAVTEPHTSETAAPYRCHLRCFTYVGTVIDTPPPVSWV